MIVEVRSFSSVTYNRCSCLFFSKLLLSPLDYWFLTFSEKNLKNIYVTRFGIFQLVCADSVISFCWIFHPPPPPVPPMRLIKTPRVFSGPKSNLQYTTHFGAGKKKRKNLVNLQNGGNQARSTITVLREDKTQKPWILCKIRLNKFTKLLKPFFI